MEFLKRLKLDKESVSERNNIIGSHLSKFGKIYILLLSAIILFETIMMVRGIFVFDFNRLKHVGYFISYIILFVTSVVVLVIMLIDKKRTVKREILSYTIHSYSLVIIGWSAFVSILDSVGNGYPIVFFTVVITVAGVAFINPFFYSVTTSISAIMYFIFANPENVSLRTAGDYINVIVFLVMAFILSFRMFRVSMTQSRTLSYMHAMSRIDSLTKLGNETAYFELVEKLDATDSHYTVIVMDLNGLKATNDKYGHRYGCHLVVEAGHVLPTIFRTSKCFHIGGDEFVVIMLGDDYINTFKKIQEFDKKLQYATIEYDGVELVLSIARGYSSSREGKNYKNVFQEADNAMYENKKMIKEKYKIESRKSE